MLVLTVKDAMLRKLAEFKSKDETLICVSDRQLSDVCADLDQRIVHLWQHLRAVELHQ